MTKTKPVRKPTKPAPPAAGDPDRLLSLREFADLLGCSLRHVHELKDRRKLFPTNIGVGRRKVWRVTLDEYARFVAAGQQASAPAAPPARRRGGRLPDVPRIV